MKGKKKKRNDERPWEERLRGLPAGAGLREKVEAVVYCGGLSGEHPRGQVYYCCEKVETLLRLFREAT